ADTGLVVNNYLNQFGCDSVEFVYTALLPTSDTTFLFWESCSPADTGIFVQHLSNVYGCDSTVVIEIDLLPTNFIIQTSLSCNPLDTGSMIQFYTNQFGCDSVVLNFVGLLPQSDTLYLEETTCITQDTGLFVNTYANAFGCDSTVVRQVSYAASDSVYLFSSSCNPQDTGYFVTIWSNQSGCDSTVFEQIDFLPSDTVLMTRFSCNPSDTGTVVVALTNQYGCDSLLITSVLLEDPDICLVDAALNLVPITCFGEAGGQLQFSVQVGSGPFSYSLTGPGVLESGTVSNLNESLTLFNLPGGDYTLQVTSATDASASYQFTINEPPLLSTDIDILSDYNGFAVSCADAFDGSIQAIGSGGVTPYTYDWSNGGFNSTLVGLPAGPYDLILTDANGCVATNSVILQAPPPIEADIDAFAVNCIEENTGQLRINSTAGGFGPYLYALNGSS
ncbi:MAG: SprB repeat-containing protein, partial [Phaeodactylibacter sp.]|nr:SprB repeat-containing protein [Phaeodactylibacter sp.]